MHCSPNPPTLQLACTRCIAHSVWLLIVLCSSPKRSCNTAVRHVCVLPLMMALEGAEDLPTASRLPDDVWRRIILCLGSQQPSLRLVCLQLRRCYDASISTINLSGSRLGAGCGSDPSAKRGPELLSLAKYMTSVTGVSVASLQQFGSLAQLPPQLRHQLRTLSISCDFWTDELLLNCVGAASHQFACLEQLGLSLEHAPGPPGAGWVHTHHWGGRLLALGLHPKWDNPKRF